jgi:hypothetical protein
MMNSNFKEASEILPGPDPQPLCIAWLLRSPTYQIRSKLDSGTVARYVNRWETMGQGLDAFPPVKVALVQGALVLVDGFHRLAAAQQAGLTEVSAVVVSATDQEARWMAAEANLSHGLPLSRKEVRQAFKVFVETRQNVKPDGRLMSYREIAVALGGAVKHNTVMAWMKEDYKRLAARMGGEDPRGGGLRSTLLEDPMAAQAKQGLAQLQAAFAGVTDPLERGNLIQEIETVLRCLREAGGYEFSEF